MEMPSEEVYAKAEEYWAKTASDVQGMLGGFEKLHVPDINDSKAFLTALRNSGHLTSFDTVLDCGSGIGRITKHLLLPMFKRVDMVDVTDKFIEQSEKYIGANNNRVGQKFVEGLQTFEPLEKTYDVIWNQWVLSHLTDDDCLEYFKRCVEGLKPDGIIVVKENLTSSITRDFDNEDHSWTRTKDEFLQLFKDANLNVFMDRRQKNFPKGMYEVRMMITALKKKFGGPPSPNPQGVRTKPGINVIKNDLQRRYANGVNFNMKVVIRGDRNVGKTCLFKRLQGQQFSDEYVPTDEIQVSNIMWNYRCSDLIVKVDVWDVVDESRRRKQKSAGLKLDNGPSDSKIDSNGPEDMMVCDATFLDVYKNCNGVLLIFDITKAWTFKYVKEELNRIPSHLPVLVLANKIDLADKREVTEEEITVYFQGFKRKPPQNGKLKAPVRLVQSSMKNANGLKYLYNFLNIPFLYVQREQLESSLEANKDDINVALIELDQFQSASNSPSHQQKPIVPNQELVEREETADGTPKLDRRNSISSGSGDENKMVDTFEEDFNSDNDDFPETSLNFQQEIQEPQEKIEFNGEVAKKEEQNLENNLNCWLDTQENNIKQQETKKEDSSDEDSNPLVAQVEGADSDSDEEDVVIENILKARRESRSVAEKQEVSAPKPKTTALDDFLNDNKVKPESIAVAPTEESKNEKKKKKTTKTKKNKEKKNDMMVEDDPDDLEVGDYEAL
ncbi:unnamed protein product [Bursaphelenchus okinawaensis]|uniref:Alpha N-terminal protein methyltransferase 1 n=1 Tax=Bursaphelenchus okinawaensis TaxID=465554 RepID=A0A811LJN6_9BILA|nr:unnamed protein product [Bursaphelenchus okinawaensis]CAG9127261.1 unnamed protein product [Bursaphelenchus okinawaensis]